MKISKKQDKELEKQIEKLYYVLADRRQIDVMKIGSLFKSAKEDHLKGMPLEDAVKSAIEKYCDPVK